MEISSLYKLCEEILPSASALALKYWGKVENIKKEVEDKTGASKQDIDRLQAKTIIDEKVQNLFLEEFIRKSINKYVSIDVEEKTDLLDKFEKGAELVFVIDPIDGTKEYVDGREDFSINIALVSSEKIEFSFVVFLVLNVTFSNFDSQKYSTTGHQKFDLVDKAIDKECLRVKYNRRTPEDYLKTLGSKKIKVEPSNGLLFPILDILKGKCDAIVAGTPNFRDIILHEILTGLYPNQLEVYDFDGNEIEWNTKQKFETYVLGRKGMKKFLN